MKITPQELILSTKLNIRLIDLDLSPEVMGPIRKIIIYAHIIPYNSSDNILYTLVYFIILS